MKTNSENSEDSLVSQFKEEAIPGGSRFNIPTVPTANRYKCGRAKRWKKHSHKPTTLEAMVSEKCSSHLKGNKG